MVTISLILCIPIEDWPHPVLGKSKAIVIESDGNLSPWAIKNRLQDEIDKLTPQEVRNIIFDAGIVGMGGASFPTHIKLNPPKPVDIVIINGAECEPYLTADYRLMIEKAEEIAKGVELVKRCLGVKKVYIAVEDNKPEAIDKFKTLGSEFEIKILKSVYPQGGEKQLIYSILKKEVPSGGLPMDAGVVVQNVGTIYAIRDAVVLGKTLFERYWAKCQQCGTPLFEAGQHIPECSSRRQLHH